MQEERRTQSPNEESTTGLVTPEKALFHDYKFHFTYDGYPKDHLICDADMASAPLYAALMSKSTTRSKPSVLLFSLRDIDVEIDVKIDGKKLKNKQVEDGVAVAVAHFPAFSKTTHMGFGNPQSPDSMWWESMKMPQDWSIGILNEFCMAWQAGFT